MQIIQNWLDGSRNFTVGSTLYKKFGTNEAFKKVLDKGSSVATVKQLAIELEKLIVPAPIEAPEPVHPARPKAPTSKDPILESLKKEWQPLYQRMNLLRHQLDKYASSNSNEAIAHRKPVAAEIKDLERQVNAVWAKQDYYLKEGKLPFIQELKLVIPTDPVKLSQLISNTKKNITRNRKLTKDHPGEPKYAQLYQDYKVQYKIITGDDYAEKESSQ